jgi:hypothetical protein
MSEILEAKVDTLAVPVMETPKLTLHDVCDSSGVKHLLESKHHWEYPSCGNTNRAYVLVQLPNGFDLRFCKHHYEKNELGLLTAGAVVLDDQRETLEVKVGVSAAG